jgi:hypothetical protein
MMRLVTAAAPVAAALVIVTPALAQNPRSVALVLDASGSMNAKLPDKQSRIEAAKAAVTDLVTKMDGSTRLGFRVYGHQSAPQKRDCTDTALLVGFDSVNVNKAEVIAKAKQIEARGYTPITHALTLAAQDLAKEAGERIVVLVSDGQETCAADPCIAAKALASADAKLVIHTIGFGVGAAARTQLQCIANVARGSYFDAHNAGDLSVMMAQAAQAKAVATKQTASSVKAGARSLLVIKNTTAGASHPVTLAEDGRQVADINGAVGQAEIPPGIYNVQFPNGIWRGVEIKPGETTVLELGQLRIEGGPGDLMGYSLLDPETEDVVVKQRMISTIPLMPTRISITSGHLVWRDIEIKAGETTVLNPARITVSGDKAGTYNVTTVDGRPAGEVSKLFTLPLPPGSYVVDVEGRRVTIELVEGQTHDTKVD